MNMTPNRKRGFVQFFLHLAASVFIGISVYGILVYWDEPKGLTPLMSVGLGFVALVCVFLIVFLGTRLDKLNEEIAAEEKDGG
jgi:hypothetical protein